MNIDPHTKGKEVENNVITLYVYNDDTFVKIKDHEYFFYFIFNNESHILFSDNISSLFVRLQGN